MADRRKLLKIVIPDANKTLETPGCIVATQAPQASYKEQSSSQPEFEEKYDHYKLALKLKAYNKAIGIYNEADLICSTESPLSVTSYMTSFPKIHSYNNFSPKKTSSNKTPRISAEDIPDSELFTIPQSPISGNKLPKHDRYTSLYKLKNKLLNRRDRRKQDLRASAFTSQRLETSSPVSFPPLSGSILQITHLTPSITRSEPPTYVKAGRFMRLKRRN
jgi:hypothetical protein